MNAGAFKETDCPLPGLYNEARVAQLLLHIQDGDCDLRTALREVLTRAPELKDNAEFLSSVKDQLEED